MALKRRISFKWRLFLPTAIGLWALLIGIVWWQWSRETDYRREYVDSQLRLINDRIVDAMNDNRPEHVHDYLQFVDDYFDREPIFDQVRVTIYNKNWEIIDAVGSPVVPLADERARIGNHMYERESRAQNLRNEHFYYRGAQTPDGEHIVLSALPNDEALRDYFAGDRTEVWAIALAVAIALTVVIYLTARYQSRNISLLQVFANRAAVDPTFMPGDDFSHDEMGDIARQILSLYVDRAKARQRMEQEHRVAMHAIEEKTRQKRQLTNNINHEIKTPIGVVKGYLDTLADNPDIDDAMRQRFIAKARDHVNRLSDLVADISAITRLDEGAGLVHTERIDFHELAFAFANDINESGAMGAMDVEVDIPVDTIIKGNANLLTGMLMNMAKNSANYSGGRTCTLGYNGETPDGQSYSFSFYDDGVGVPDDTLPHLFDRFYRIDSGRARANGGTGLGLAIVYNTVTAHHGTIVGLNRPGGGLEIRFTLPKWRKT